ncbi:CoA transferase [Amycolatopsis endophytica]|uniref:Crotonobetainyl-CoA:carnitine CoA-transferase CaiB-like acyl-CoA transferase n=1 Tax=Amycolatopsis endophytica TaxID=860233 RepID=A0A853AZB3_9PSEU|nr:CoA transferase [Amycolatopsis endophytica]NYI88108.1 crotonobetainyl-CoA:carnitine CoA-transferase CaiB-like acyl-CoA transferase [Amycolatopsis endophytica]
MPEGLLRGCRVIDLSTLFAGPFAAMMLGDHGADVVKVEHPSGDDLRNWGHEKDGHPLFFRMVNRNKRLIAVDLHEDAGQEVIRRLLADADVLISNFRPGRLEAWGLGWPDLRRLNPRLVHAAVSGFGQTGPYSRRPGFGTIAEAMSGFAAVTGTPSGTPVLPPFGLADGIAGITTAFAVSAALWDRERTGSGVQIDTALYEPLMSVVGSHIVEYDQLGSLQERMGNAVPQIAPRNTYRTRDGHWVVLSGAAQNVAERLLRLVGGEEAVNDPRFATNPARLANREALDRLIGRWITVRPRSEVLDSMAAADVAVAPVYDASDILGDEHFRIRGSIIEVEDMDLGWVRMQGPFPAVPQRPGSVSRAIRDAIGTDTDTVLQELGYAPAEISELASSGTIARRAPTTRPCR